MAAAALVTGLATIPVLEMIRTRLSVQRNFGDEGHAILLATEGEKEVVAEYPEKVIESVFLIISAISQSILTSWSMQASPRAIRGPG